MARSSTSFGEDNQPEKRRGKGRKNILLDAIKKKMESEGVEVRDRDHAEELFADKLVEQAFAQVAIGENTLFNEVTNRVYPKFKPTSEPVNFEFPENGTHTEKFNAIMVAVSLGELAPDTGGELVKMLNTGVNIEDVTELKAKIEEIEKAMKADA